MKTNQSATFSAVPCDPPKNMAVKNVTATSIIVHWSYHGNCSVPGFIQGYRLAYQMHGTVPSPRTFLKVTGRNKSTVLLKGLKPYSTYSIQLQVMTATGKDGRPSTAWVRTKEGGRRINMARHG